MQLQIHLDERQSDRVFVTVCLSPQSECAQSECTTVQGVAVELRSRSGEPLSARLMLPVSGPLPGPLALRTELRARDDLPRGARVHGIVWWAKGQIEVTCPTDPGTTLEAYAYGSSIGLEPSDPSPQPRDLSNTERRRLYLAYPWMARYRAPSHTSDEDHILEEAPSDLASDIADTYDLSDEDRAILEELLAEDDDGHDGGSQPWADQDLDRVEP